MSFKRRLRRKGLADRKNEYKEKLKALRVKLMPDVYAYNMAKNELRMAYGYPLKRTVKSKKTRRRK